MTQRVRLTTHAAARFPDLANRTGDNLVTPIEAAARAIATENFRRQFGHAPSPGWNADRHWRQHIPAARAVIEAIREPSDAMIEAGWDVAREESAAATWQAMTDALLAEHPAPLAKRALEAS